MPISSSFFNDFKYLKGFSTFFLLNIFIFKSFKIFKTLFYFTLSRFYFGKINKETFFRKIREKRFNSNQIDF